jgi:hypothetical protein
LGREVDVGPAAVGVRGRDGRLYGVGSLQPASGVSVGQGDGSLAAGVKLTGVVTGVCNPPLAIIIERES